MSTSTDSPGVHFPPPLLYASAVIAGWLLDGRWPLPIGGAWRTVLGWVFVAGWAVLAASAIGLFRRKQTSMITDRHCYAVFQNENYQREHGPGTFVPFRDLTAAASAIGEGLRNSFDAA